MTELARPIRVLLDMQRASEDAHAGIPQETRLLFRGLSLLEDVRVEGLMQSAERVLAQGLPAPGSAELARLRPDEQLDRLGRVVITLEEGHWSSHARAVMYTVAMALWHLCGRSQTLSHFNSTRHFRDYLWWRFFALTLPAADFEAVTSAGFRVARMPWNAMHVCALVTRRLGLPALFVRVDTSDFDVMIAQTPYPASVASSTQLIVRYHDAFPMTMPYTIGERYYHQAFHYQGLRHNVERGAWFACVSEATRNDLVDIFPQAAQRSATIHNIVSHDYFDEASTPARVPEIIKTRLLKGVQKLLSPSMNRRRFDELPAAVPPDYLLIVSRVEPRKNHLTLLAAWERLRSTCFPALQLIAVGPLGSHHEPILRKFLPWVEQGVAHMLEDVPSADLRLLYKHARATVCPTVGEGFGFAGVEAMRCGGAVVASDIPVHREIYADAAIYFNLHDLSDAVQAITTVIDPAQPARRAEMIERGAHVSARYDSAAIMPQWLAFLRTVMDARGRPA